MEVRTGKTLTSLSILDEIEGVDSVLFITKKKAIPSIEEDYSKLSPSFYMEAINYESLHKVEMDKIDAVVCDEAHSMGAYPKPSKRARDVKAILQQHDPYLILMSGTPTPESYSQIYHQMYGSRNSPFAGYKSFYRFADDYVNVKLKYLGHGNKVNDYSGGLESILDEIDPYTISFTQKEAGFASEIEEEILHVKMSDKTYKMCDILKRDMVIEGSNEVILADTGVKLMSKLHQMYSGTVKFESGNSMTLDTSKGEFIKSRFNGKRIGVFYKFKEELKLLKSVFDSRLTEDVEAFNNYQSDVIALQIVSGREGISLRTADYIVFYNIDFSATSYWQARDRMTTKDRGYNKVFWIFSEGGIESKIYTKVVNKKDYTLKHFRSDFL